MNVQHVGVAVRDAEQSLRFYVEGFGLEQLARPDFGIPGYWLGDASGMQVHLIELPDAAPFPPGVHLAFESDDLDADMARLASLGTLVEQVVEGRGRRQAFLKDPSGNTIELNEIASGTTV